MIFSHRMNRLHRCFLGAALLTAMLACAPAVAQTYSRDLPPRVGPDDGTTLTVAGFLRGMDVFGRLGPELAEKDPDYVAAIRGLAHIGERYRIDLGEAKAAGTTLDSCPVMNVKVTTGTLVPFLLRLPPEQQTMPMAQAFRLHMRELYPCPPARSPRRQ